MKRYEHNPAYATAPYEYVVIDKWGQRYPLVYPARYMTVEDALARRNPVPPYIEVEVPDTK
jgi:hypothetical protein